MNDRLSILAAMAMMSLGVVVVDGGAHSRPDVPPPMPRLPRKPSAKTYRREKSPASCSKTRSGSLDRLLRKAKRR